MKIRVSFKTPDALYYAINDKGIKEEDSIYDEISKIASKWISYGECITIEIDTEIKTCVVIEND